MEEADVLSKLQQKPDLALESLDKLAVGRFAGGKHQGFRGMKTFSTFSVNFSRETTSSNHIHSEKGKPPWKEFDSKAQVLSI